MRKNKSLQHGFTLVEVGIVVPILMLTAITLFGVLFMMIKTSVTERTQSAIMYDIQTALDIIEDDTTLTSTFLSTTDSTISDPYSPSGGWSYLGNGSGSRVLVLRAYATTTNPLSTARMAVFVNTQGCTPTTIFFNNVLQYNTVYFVQNGNLYRRKAIDTSQMTCDAPYQKQSCPSLEALGSGSRDSICRADDELIARDVSNFDVQYFGTRTSTTPLNVYGAGTDPNAVTISAAAEVSLTITRKAYGADTPVTSKLRMTKLNTNSEAN